MAEAARILYVGATRARDHLIVSLHHQAGRANQGGAARLIGAGATEHALTWEPAAAPRGTRARRWPISGWTARRAPPRSTPRERAALVARARTVRYTSATGIAAAAAVTPPRPGRGGRRRAVGPRVAEEPGWVARCTARSRACPWTRTPTRSPRRRPPRPRPRRSRSAGTRWRPWSPRPSAPRPPGARGPRGGRCARCPSRSARRASWWRASSTWSSRRAAASRSSTGRPTT